MHYTPEVTLAFFSIENIMRNINYGWLFRYLHSNGASFFFILIYGHIARSLYYRSFLGTKIYLWYTGVAIFILAMATAFMGYVLPWGQMSFWGATVITNLFTAIPKVGQKIACWLWGGFSIDNATLNRFFSIHYLLPFLILGLVFIHLILLHMDGSTNPLNLVNFRDKVNFYPYFYTKDLIGASFIYTIFLIYVCFEPNLMGHPDNYIKADPLVTPTHIVPEWYFLPFYAILRSIPDKAIGVILMAGAILMLAFLPSISSKGIYNQKANNPHKISCLIFFFTSLILGWLGGKPAEEPFVLISQLCTFLYFAYFLICIPILNSLEKTKTG